ncbi:MAG: hypothetical protein LW875_10770, partial [Proteobacteria bacterium]|nr:hypothetical protein [Pseudomonadota bacterium]
SAFCRHFSDLRFQKKVLLTHDEGDTQGLADLQMDSSYPKVAFIRRATRWRINPPEYPDLTQNLRS